LRILNDAKQHKISNPIGFDLMELICLKGQKIRYPAKEEEGDHCTKVCNDKFII
jgi:hypothetical protein